MIAPLSARRWPSFRETARRWPSRWPSFRETALRTAALRESLLYRALWWTVLRVVVGALAVGAVLGLAQLTVHLLVVAYAGVTPYA